MATDTFHYHSRTTYSKRKEEVEFETYTTRKSDQFRLLTYQDKLETQACQEKKGGEKIEYCYIKIVHFIYFT